MIAEWIPFLFLLCPVVLALVTGRIVLRRMYDAPKPLAAVIPFTGDRPPQWLSMPVDFATLRELNHERYPLFKRKHSPAGFVACIAEEHGEVAECVLGLTGEKRRKEHKTVRDLGHELADVVTYCDALADEYGIDLGDAVREKFNIVSARVGYGRVWQ